MGVQILDNFDIGQAKTLDSRMVYTGIISPNSINSSLSPIPNKYLGLITYATGDRNLYVYQLGAVEGFGAPEWEKIVTTPVDTTPVITSNFNFIDAYNGLVLYVSGSSPITGTLPAGGSSLNSLGSGYNVTIVQMGNSPIIFNGAPNIFFRNRLNLNQTAGLYAVASILRMNQTEFLLYGDLV